MVTSDLRVSAKSVDYKTQIVKHSFYLTDEFRSSDQTLRATEGISFMERVILYIKQLLYYTSIEKQIILNFYIVVSEKGMFWKDEGEQEELHNEFYKIYRDICLFHSKCYSGA
jgi:hypothetical protein